MEDVQIRDEQPDDAPGIATLLRGVFDGDLEATLVEQLRAGGEYAFSMVADCGGEIAGHAGFARAAIETKKGTLAVIWLVPVGVGAAYQARGIGSAVVREGLERCRAQGFDYAVVVGNPDYYQRFGFGPAPELQSRFAGEALMLAPLGGDESAAPAGKLVEPRAFAMLE